MMRRAVAVLVVIAALGAADVAAADSQYRFIQFNVCGSVPHSEDHPYCNGGETLPISREVQGIAEMYKPYALSLNEICQDQFNRILWDLNSNGAWSMHGHFVTTLTSSDSNNCPSRRFGNAILVRRPILFEPAEYTLPEPDGTQEPRKMGCVVSDLPRPTVFCTVHITRDEEWKRAQIAKVQNTVQLWVNDGTPVVLMGDFNVTPRDYRLDRLYDPSHWDPETYGQYGIGSFQEVDENEHPTITPCTCGEGTLAGSPTTKLDYIFVSSDPWRALQGDVKPATNSDHEVLHGVAWLIH